MPGDGAAGAGDGVVRDSRFKTLHNDPRFMNFPAATNKTKIDGRFAKMFSDPNFGTGARGNRDKRGRKTDKARRKSAADDLKQYYDLEEEEEEEEEERDAAEKKKSAAKKRAKKKRVDPESDEEEEEEEEEDEDDSDEDDSEEDSEDADAKDAKPEADLDRRLEASRDRMRGVHLSDSDSDSDSESDSELNDAEHRSDSEEGVIPRMLAGGGGSRDDEDDAEPGMIDATARVAVVNQEWQHLRAVDLLVVLRSFAPKSGEVLRVTVYPSDFGLKRMAEEARHGPLAAFGKTAGDARTAATKEKTDARKTKKAQRKKRHADLDSDDSDVAGSSDSESDSENDANADAVRERMRAYERDRMTYYYAICECDSATTAAAVYSSCDGLEFERSANKLDLRYVPDEQSFEGREIRDASSVVPSDYEPPEFQVKALQQTNVKLSWDDDDPARKKAFARKLTEDKLKDEDFAAYMASASEDEEDEDEGAPEDTEAKTDAKTKTKKKALSEADAAAAKKAYLAKLLGGGDAADDEDADEDEDEDDENEEDDLRGDDSDDSGDEGFKRAAWGSARDGVSAANRYGDKAARRAASGRNRTGDMEVTFHAGLEELGEKMRRRKEELSGGGAKETVREKHLREKAEKREKKKKKKSADDDDDDDADASLHEEKIRMDDVDTDGDAKHASGFDDPFFADAGDVDFDAAEDDDSGDEIGEKRSSKKNADVFALAKRESKKASKRRAKASADDPEAAKERADLELLMMDDDAVLGGSRGTVRHTNSHSRDAENSTDAPALSKKKSRKARLAEKKKLRGKDARRRESDDEDDEGFSRNEKTNVDVSDDRFKGLFESEKFALDPTDPRFRETKAADFIAEERARRRSAKKSLERKNRRIDRRSDEDEDGENAKTAKSATEKKSQIARGDDVALRAMVSGLKRKSEAAARAREDKGSKRR